MVLENLVKGVKYVAGGLALGASMLFGGAVMSGCSGGDEDPVVNPNEISNFIATDGNYQNELTWNNPADMTMKNVTIRRKQDSFPIDHTDGILIYSGTGTAYTDSSLNAGTLYCYKAFLFSYTEPFPITETQASATPFDGMPPGNVSNLTSTAHEGAIELNWINPTDSDFAGVVVRRKIGSLNFPTSPTDGTLVYQGTGQTVTESGLNDTQTYCYMVYAYDLVNNFASGIYKSATPGSYNAPGEASNFLATPSYSEATHKWTVDLTWTNPGDADFAGVIIRRKTGPAFPADHTDGTLVYQGTGQSHSDGNLDDAMYTYGIFTYDTLSNYSNGDIEQLTLDYVYFIGWIGDGSDGWKTGFGATSGNDQRRFDHPRGVHVDNSGNIYIADEWNNRICKWNSNGNFVGWIGGGAGAWISTLGAQSGSGIQYFSSPHDVFVDTSGSLYIADIGNHRISKWNSSGTCLGWIGKYSSGWSTSSGTSSGNGLQEFDCPRGVSVDSSGNIFVSDTNNRRICKWTSSGNTVGWIGGGFDGWQTTSGTTYGPDYKYFQFPFKVHVDSSGDIYVADTYNHRIAKWNSSGTAHGFIGCGNVAWQNSSNCSSGTNKYSFNCPDGVFVKGGYIYVADTENHRVCKWDMNGVPIGWIGGGSNGWQTGNAPGSGNNPQFFYKPHSVFVDNNGNIYVTDWLNHRVCKWKD